MQTVPYILGLAHPNGFPTEILTGWLFTHAVPFGSVAMRMTILCAAFGLLSAWLCYRIAVSLGAFELPALLAAAGFAFTAVVWKHVTRTDVIDPSVAFAALTTYACILGARRRELGASIAAGVCAGLTLGTHAVVVFYLPASFLLLWTISKERTASKLAVFGVACCTAAVCVYAYMPLRATVVERARLDPTWALGLAPGTPIWDWGAPSNLERFLAVVSGASVNAPHAVVGMFAVTHVRSYAAFLWARITATYPIGELFVVLLAVIAALFAAQRAVIWLLVPLVLVTPFAASFDAESDVSRYYVLPLLFVWSAVAIGASGNRLLPLRRNIVRAVASGILAFVAYTHLYALPRIYDQHDDRLASTFIRSVLDSTDADAAIVVPWVYGTPLAYAAYVDHSVGRRLIVVESPSDDAGTLDRYRRWKRPVYVIDEKPHATPSFAFVRAFAINADPATNPKLYRFVSHGRSGAAETPGRAMVRYRDGRIRS